MRRRLIYCLNLQEKLNYLSSLIDWAHQNDLDFHVTEIDYRLVGNSPTSTNFNRQAHGYANIVKTLISKRKNNVIKKKTRLTSSDVKFINISQSIQAQIKKKNELEKKI